MWKTQTAKCFEYGSVETEECQDTKCRHCGVCHLVGRVINDAVCRLLMEKERPEELHHNQPVEIFKVYLTYSQQGFTYILLDVLLFLFQATFLLSL